MSEQLRDQSQAAIIEHTRGGGLHIDTGRMVVGVGYQTIWQMESVVFVLGGDGHLRCYLEKDWNG